MSCGVARCGGRRVQFRINTDECWPPEIYRALSQLSWANLKLLCASPGGTAAFIHPETDARAPTRNGVRAKISNIGRGDEPPEIASDALPLCAIASRSQSRICVAQAVPAAASESANVADVPSAQDSLEYRIGP